MSEYLETLTALERKFDRCFDSQQEQLHRAISAEASARAWQEKALQLGNLLHRVLCTAELRGELLEDVEAALSGAWLDEETTL